MAEHQGQALGDLGAGLASHGVLADGLGAGELQRRQIQRFLQQAPPFLQEAGGGLLGPVGGGGEVHHERCRPAAGWVAHPHVVGQAPFLPHHHEQAARHAQSQVGLEQPQRQGIGMAERHGGAPQHQHELFGVLHEGPQAGSGRWYATWFDGWRRYRRRGQGQVGGPRKALQGLLQQGLEVVRQGSGEHQNGALSPQTHR